MKPSIRRVTHGLLGLALAGIAGGACSSSSSTPSYDSANLDPFVYYSQYPADVYYSSYYWADPYYFFFVTNAYQGGPPNTGATVVQTDGGMSVTVDVDASAAPAPVVTPTDAGASNATGRQSFGDVIRALARGDNACPGQVTVTPRMAPNPCPASGSDMIRSGVEIAFAGCQLPNGGTLDGNIDVQTTRVASDVVCAPTTTITISHTVTVANLAYTGPSARRLVIPNQTATGMGTFVNGQRPTTATATLDGRMQLFAADGSLIADRTYLGDIMVTPAQAQGTYAIDGTLTLDDVDGSGSTTLTATSLARTGDCCRPVGGMLSATRTGQRAFAMHVWSFNSTCGAVTFDGRAVLMGPCL